MLFSPSGGVQFFKLNLELVNEHVKVVEKSLSLGGLFTCFIYKKVINRLRVRFILVSSYSV